MSFLFRVCVVAVAFACAVFNTDVVQAKDGKFVIKFATIAPEGTAWMKIMRECDKELQEKTAGRVKFRFYPGGVLGDEMDVFRKMRMKQVHCAGFSGVGFGAILPDVRVLDVPFLFRSQEEVDTVQSRLENYFSGLFLKKNFVFLGWANIGFVNVFSNSSVSSLEDLKKTKLWVWQGDPVAEKTFAGLGIPIIPLSVMDVMTSLQTGMIDTVYASALGALALQWHTRTKYVWDFPIVHSTGGILMHKRFFDSMPKELQDIVSEVVKKHAARLSSITVEDNKKALELIRSKGLTFTPAPDTAGQEALWAQGLEIKSKMVGNLFSAESAKRVDAVLEEIRK